MSDDTPAQLLKTIGGRLTHALKAENRSQGEAERALGFSKGDLSKYSNGKRGASSVDVDKWMALARYLHVEFVWLVAGVGPMRPGGRDRTPAEEAIVLARGSGIPDETTQAAWDRYKDRAATMTAMDWALVIHNEHQVSLRPAAQDPKPLDPGLPPARVDRKRKLPPRRPGGEQ